MNYTHLKGLVDAALQREQWETAVSLLQRHVHLTRRHYDLSWNLGWALLRLGDDLKAAAEWLERAVRLAPTKPEGWWALGVVFAERGFFDEAEHALRESLRLGDSYLARLELGVLYEDSGRFDEAEAVYREGVSIKPNEKRRHVRLAEFLEDQDRHDEAQAVWQDAGCLPDEPD